MTSPPTNRGRVESLLAETSWLRRLADELVPKADRDDLVQDVIVRALQQRETPQSLRAWLATVARNLASRMRLRQRHREEREFTVGSTRAPNPSAAEAAEHFATHRAIVAAVDALDEPMRTAVLLRFFEGLPPREVALRAGVPVETARTRIKRGLERLRQALDERAGDRRTWATAVLSLPGVSATAAVTPPAASLVAFLTMKTLALGVAVLLAAGLWFAWPSTPELEATQQANSVRSEGGAVEAAAEATSRVDEAPTAQRVAAPPPLRGSIRAAVRRPDGSTAKGIGIAVWPSNRPDAHTSLATDADGTAVCEDLEPGTYTVRLDRGPRREIRVQPGERTDCAFALPPGCTVRGTVERLDAIRVADAAVIAIGVDHPDTVVELGRTGEDGTFLLHDVPERTLLLARKAGWQPSHARGVEVTRSPGGEQEVRLMLGAEAYSLAGTVHAPDGRPAPHAMLLVAVDEDCRKRLAGLVEVRSADGKGGLDRESILLRADAEGRFATEDVPFGEVVVFARGATGFATCTGLATTLVQRHAGNRVDVRLQPAATVRGVVRDENGVPHGGFALRLSYDESEALGELLRDTLAQSVLSRLATVAQDGSFCFDGLLPGEYDLRLDLAPRRDRLQKVDVPAEGLELEVVVPRPRSLRVRVEDAEGRALPGFAVVASRDATIPMRQAKDQVTNADGECTLPSLSSEAVWLTVHAPRTGSAAAEPFHRLPSVVQRLDRMQGEVVVVAAMPSASVALRVVDADGRPRADARLEFLLPPSDEKVRATADQGGVVRCSGLAAGTYHLVAKSGDRSIEREFVLQHAQALDLGDLRLDAAATLEVEVFMDGRPCSEASVHVLRRGATERSSSSQWSLVQRLDSSNGVHSSTLLEPGEYWLEVFGPSFAATGRAVTLALGAPSRVRIEPEPGCEQRIQVELSDAADRAADRGYAQIEVLDDEGRPRLAQGGTMPFTRANEPVAEFVVRLVPGTYTVKAHGRTGEAVASLLVEPGAPPVRIALR